MAPSPSRALTALAAATSSPAAARPALRSAVAFRRAKLSFSSSPSPPSPPSPNIRRFPLPGLRVGTDICDVARIHAIIGGSAGAPIASSSAPSASPSSSASSSSRAARFVRRILTPQELPPTAISSSSASAASAASAPSSSSQLLAWLLAGSLPTTTAADAADSRLHDATLWKAARFLAGRFAAKEAVIKAHPHLRLTFHQIRIVRTKDDASNGSGPPVALIRLPATADADVDEGDGVAVEQEALLSISHDGTYATAVCIGFQDLGS